MTDNKQTIMDIAMNLNRIGNWVADDFEKNQKKIQVFIINTDGYISTIQNLNSKFKPTWLSFMDVYPMMKSKLQSNAENLMTWGNILTHRASLIES
ncbi:MAG: hypothetical protein Q8Q30_03330 [Candidatus Woesebacteria bacterium]|nr:hypothetical protein [Candidatus Woesebacteria bacterium]